MANLILAYPNRSDDAVLSGGVWQIPLARLQTRILADVARSADLDPAHTRVDVALERERPVMLVTLVRHTLTRMATYRLSAGSAAGQTDLYDSGWREVWPTIYPQSTLSWDSPSWWDGRISEEDRAGYPANLVHVMEAGVFARYWRLELSDPSNPAGYVEAGRLYIAEQWQPIVNCNWGYTLGWEDKTGVEETLDGVEYFDERPRYRVARFQLAHMDTDEAYGQAFELQRRQGISGEVFLLTDPADAMHRIRHGFLGRVRQLSPIEATSHQRHGSTFEIKEIV